MKIRIIRFLKRFLLILIICLAVIKSGFEIDNYYYESKLRKMKENGELTVQLNSPVENKKLIMDGYEIYYNLYGTENKNSIIFLHPAFSDQSVFNQQIDYFAKDYKVITIDIIGHGLSQVDNSKDKVDASADHILKIIELENISKTNLVGISIGSLIAQYFALKSPDHVTSLVALGGYNINKENKDVAKAQRSSNIGLVLRALFSMKAFRKKAAKITCSTEKGQALFYNTTALFTRRSFLVMQGFENIIKDRKNVKPDYTTLIMSGEFDIDLAKKMAKDWHSQCENTEHYIIKNAGHSANIDNPTVFNETVKDFIDRNN